MSSRARFVLSLALASGLPACVVPARGVDAAAGRDAGHAVETCTEAGHTLGAPCQTAGECDDGCFCNGAEVCGDAGQCVAGPAACADDIECTFDACVEATNECVFDPVAASCDDGDACNGREGCSPTRGCIPSLLGPLACADDDPCTFDTCDPAVGCTSMPVDFDGDGHAPSRCAGGDDCRDDDDRVHPDAPEVCDNGRDDDCDDLRDTEDPVCTPTNDVCATAQAMSVLAPPSTTVVPAATRSLAADYALGCRELGGPDAVFTFHQDALGDVLLEARGSDPAIALRTLAGCTIAEDLACIASTRHPAALRVRSLPPGNYAVIVQTRTEGPVELRVVQSGDVTAPVDGDDCSTAVEAAGMVTTIAEEELVDGVRTSCSGETSSLFTDAVFYFDVLAARAPETVRVSASHPGGSLSLAVATECGDLRSELACVTRTDGGTLDLPSLAAGRYFVTVATQVRGGDIRLEILRTPG